MEFQILNAVREENSDSLAGQAHLDLPYSNAHRANNSW
jgi:hypothetical protein